MGRFDTITADTQMRMRLSVGRFDHAMQWRRRCGCAPAQTLHTAKSACSRWAGVEGAPGCSGAASAASRLAAPLPLVRRPRHHRPRVGRAAVHQIPQQRERVLLPAEGSGRRSRLETCFQPCDAC
jgi:hypothetical protein